MSSAFGTPHAMSPQTAATTMKQRKLGNAGPWVSAIGMGCFSFTGGYGAVSDAEARDTLYPIVMRTATRLLNRPTGPGPCTWC